MGLVVVPIYTRAVAVIPGVEMIPKLYKSVDPKNVSCTALLPEDYLVKTENEHSAD